jgi:hypothetical protein
MILPRLLYLHQFCRPADFMVAGQHSLGSQVPLGGGGGMAGRAEGTEEVGGVEVGGVGGVGGRVEGSVD